MQLTCRPAGPVDATVSATPASVTERAAPAERPERPEPLDRPAAGGVGPLSVDKKPPPHPLRRCFLEDSAQSPPRSLSVLLAQSADRFEQGIQLAKQANPPSLPASATASSPGPATASSKTSAPRPAAPNATAPAPTSALAPEPAATNATAPVTTSSTAPATTSAPVPGSAPGAAPPGPAATAGPAPGTAQFEAALACAEEALRLDGRSVEALHNRGLALQELGQLDLARDSFTRALAIDPDDPETLAGAADLYINRLAPSSELSEIGVEYAHRGSQRLRRSLGPAPAKSADKPSDAGKDKAGKDKAAPESAKDRGERALLGRLLLLEAQGLNDLGRPREALQRLDVAIVASDSSQARYERAMALLDLCRFTEASRAFHDVLTREPGDAWAHYSLGLTLEMLGQQGAADLELAQARQLAPREFPALLPVNPEQFRALVDKEVQALTPGQRADLGRVSLQTAELPELGDLTAEDPPLSPTILGLFRGLPLDEAPGPGDQEPRAIVLYRKNLLRAVREKAELVEQIRTTLLHELGHLRGEDDAELRARGLE